MTTMNVFVRGEKTGDRDLISSMLKAIQIEDWQLFDLMVFELKDIIDAPLGIAFGETCSRLIGPKVKKLFTLPALDKLKPDPKNDTTRKKAWTQLQEIKKFLETYDPNAQPIPVDDVMKSEKDEWIVVVMVSGKKLCVYEGKSKPQKVEADAFMTREDLRLLLALKEAVGAEQVIFQGGTELNEGVSQNTSGEQLSLSVG